MPDTAPQTKFRRVMLKISGEALMGDQGFGLHPPTVERIAREVQSVHNMGVEICMVIGGGNIFRYNAVAGFGDHTRLAHALGQHGLADGVVDLVRAGVVQVFALQVNLRATHFAAHASCMVDG